MSQEVAPAAELDVASTLAQWAVAFAPSTSDLALADRSLTDTIAVAAAGRHEPEVQLLTVLEPAGRAAALAHLIDYDDLHIPSTTHISAVCVAAALATGGAAHAYLTGAGVMARLGMMLGWRHYDAGWHATCTAGALAAAVTAGVAMGLDADGLGTALALAVPAAGGVNRAFGTSGKSLQVGFAVDAGVRAARLAERGASADPAAVAQWLELLGGSPVEIPPDPTVPGGLAVKAYPCCYALQRPIAAILLALDDARPSPSEVRRVVVRAPQVTVRPLIHDRPVTGLQGKFSLQYGVAAAILDGVPALSSFTDTAVARASARELMGRVTLEPSGEGVDLLAGATEVELDLAGGGRVSSAVTSPPGAPDTPLSDVELLRKVTDCAGPANVAEVLSADWGSAGGLIDGWLE